MASRCPKCHEWLDEDAVCCADVKYNWKCDSCGKLSQGFVVPYGHCMLCGGRIKVVEDYKAEAMSRIGVIKDAMQFEIDMYQFYRLALRRTKNELLRAVLEDLYQQEEEHLTQLENKYHVHLDPSIRELAAKVEERVAGGIFEGIDFKEDDHVLAVYDKAIEMERRTRDYFKAGARKLPDGLEKELCRELAAEEEEHVALLETEREQFVSRANKSNRTS